MPIATACTASRLASSRRPAPKARATADEMPPPTAPADIICISITAGNTSAMPAKAAGAEPADKIGLDEAEARLHDHHQHVRRGEADQRRAIGASISRLVRGSSAGRLARSSAGSGGGDAPTRRSPSAAWFAAPSDMLSLPSQG
jgi:hypothetical protein